MKFISAGVLALISVIISFFSLDEKTKIFNVLSEEDGEQIHKIKKTIKILIIVLVGAVGFVSTLCLYKTCSLTINIIRLQIVYVCMAGAACVDLREHRIPNIFPTIMALSGIFCLAYMYFGDIDGAMSYILSSLVGAVLCAVSMLIIYALTKGGIGMGDIKLLCSLALLGGANALAGCACFGSITCGVLTLILVATKKKSIKEDALPFAPFAFIGFVISIVFPVS